VAAPTGLEPATRGLGNLSVALIPVYHRLCLPSQPPILPDLLPHYMIPVCTTVHARLSVRLGLDRSDRCPSPATAFFILRNEPVDDALSTGIFGTRRACQVVLRCGKIVVSQQHLNGVPGSTVARKERSPCSTHGGLTTSCTSRDRQAQGDPLNLATTTSSVTDHRATHPLRLPGIPPRASRPGPVTHALPRRVGGETRESRAPPRDSPRAIAQRNRCLRKSASQSWARAAPTWHRRGVVLFRKGGAFHAQNW
jgi:hypothetical protein